MNNTTYYPEGMFPQALRADEMTREQLKKAYQEGTILEATARSATPAHDLLVDLGAVQGVIPRTIRPSASQTAVCGILRF